MGKNKYVKFSEYIGRRKMKNDSKKLFKNA